MSDLRTAAQQALEALQWHYRQGHSNTLGGFRLKIDEKALRELSAALAQQDEPVTGRAFLERILAAMEGVIDVADRKTDEFDALRSCVIDLTVMLHAAPPQRVAQQAEPVARECSDPMCACRGGPCAECEEGEREKEIEDLRSSLYFYQRRCEALQSWQSKMRDPERTIVCDILANGKTLDSAVAGDRYTAPPQRPAEPAQEPVAWYQKRGQEVLTSHPACWGREDEPWTPLYTAPPHQKQVGWMQKSTGVIRCDWGFDTTGYVPVYAAQEKE